MVKQEARIEITASDKTRAAFQSAKRGLTDLQTVAGRLNSSMATLGVGLAGGGLLAFAKGAIDAADNLNDLSQKIGVSVEHLAGYKLAAEQSGTSLEAIAITSRVLAKNIAEGDKTLKAMGITSTDVNGAMEQLADVFAAMPDGAQKTALALKLMGKSGSDMIPLLNGGGAALREMVAEGQNLYPVTTEMARAADQFNDSLAKLKTGAEGLGVRIGNALLPSLNNLIREAEEGTRIFGGFWRAFVGVGLLTNPFKSAGENLKDVRRQIEEIESGKIKMGDGGKRLGFLRQQEQYLKSQRAIDLGLPTREELHREAERQRREVDAALKGVPKVDLGGGKAGGKGASAAAPRLEDLSQTPAARIAKQYQEVLDDLNRQAAEAADRDFILFDAPAFEAEGRALDDYRQRLAGLIDDTTLAKTERLRESIDILNRAFFDGEIGVQQYDEAMGKLTTSTDKLAEKAEEANDIARELGLSFSSAFEDAVVGGKKFGDVLRGLYDDLVRLTVRKAVTEPLAEGFGGLLKGINFGSLLPGFAVGTDYVPRDMVARVHKGEAIIPAAENRAGRGGGVTVNMTVVAQDAGSFRKSMGQIQSDLAFAMQGARRFS